MQRSARYDPPVRHEHVHTLSCTTDVPIIVSLTIADLIDDGTDVIGVGAPMVGSDVDKSCDEVAQGIRSAGWHTTSTSLYCR